MAETAAREAELLAKVPTGLLINGEWRDASDGGTFEVADPATGKVLATLASATSEDALAALDAADKVQASWARTAPRERAEILRRGFELVTERAEDFALLMTMEMGKPLAESRGEVTYGAEFLRWFSEEAVRDYGRYLTTPEGKNKILVTAQAGRPVPADHAVELPARHGHAQGRTRRRRRLHDGAQAGQAHPADQPALRPDHDGSGPPGRRAERGLVQERVRDLRAADAGLPPPQGFLHRFHPGGQAAAQGRGKQRAAHLDGARRQRPLHRVRGCRPG